MHIEGGSRRRVDWEAARALGLRRGGALHGEDGRRSRYPFCITWTPIPLLTWLFPFIGHMGIADSRGVIYDFAGPYTIGIDDMAFGKPTRVLRLDPLLVHDTTGAGGEWAGSSSSGAIVRPTAGDSDEDGDDNDDGGSAGGAAALDKASALREETRALQGKGSEALDSDDGAGGNNSSSGSSSTSLAAARIAAWDAAVDTACQVYLGRMHNLVCDNCHSHVARALNTMRYGGRSDWNMVKLAAWVFFKGRHVSLAAVIETWLPFSIILAVVVVLKALL